jgi:hypothetical protein
MAELMAPIIFGFVNLALLHAASESSAFEILEMPSKAKTRSKFVPR